jgi:predicted ATPase
MNDTTPPHYVLTGGPCAGKTTTIEALRERGFSVSPEAGRIYIEEQLAQGKEISDLLLHLDVLEKNILRKHVELEAANRNDGIVFFDRGIPDCLAYYRIYDVPEDDELRSAIANASYKRIFLLDMMENFSNDAVRFETPEQARRIHETIREAYRELGHEIVEVPVMPVGERADFVLANI